ncbi:MurR/RpiR family transcriptional regulator [Ammoniphilus sp. CFH 90114]|nr:MurR/RpiR family transcriptional regulator [Ammoniphilus sp. CFH 90114]
MKKEDAAAFLTIDRLAAEAGVSAASITRFATEIGFSGYPDLQKALRLNLQQRLNPTQRLQSSMGIEDNSLFSRSFQKDMENINEAIKLNPTPMLESVVQLLLRAQNVYIVAYRSSYSLASYFYVILEQILGNVNLVNNLENMKAETLLRMTKRDVLISISFPRYNQQTLDFTKLAYDRGVKILPISDSLSAPLIQYSDVYLISPFESMSFYNSYVPVMSLINALSTELAAALKEEVKERLTLIDQMSDTVYYPLTGHGQS